MSNILDILDGCSIGVKIVVSVTYAQSLVLQYFFKLSENQASR